MATRLRRRQRDRVALHNERHPDRQIALPPAKTGLGHRCLGCKQRIKPLTQRLPVFAPERKRLLGFRHPGCST